jgi:ribosomal protein S18 acetylase RimI-like enzyme
MRQKLCDYKQYELYRMSAQGDSKEFYAEMGHIFASREIRKELDGYPIDNTPERMWIVAYLGEKVVGFRSYGTDSKGEGVFFDAWVREDCRRNGLYRRMLQLAEQDLREIGARIIRAIGNDNSTPILQEQGFKILRKRGRFNVMEKVIA